MGKKWQQKTHRYRETIMVELLGYIIEKAYTDIPTLVRRCKISHNQLIKYRTIMLEYGLIEVEGDGLMRITERGMQFHRMFTAAMEFLHHVQPVMKT